VVPVGDQAAHREVVRQEVRGEEVAPQVAHREVRGVAAREVVVPMVVRTVVVVVHTAVVRMANPLMVTAVAHSAAS
jgi:uncharacterized membrane protein YGL010W